MALLVKLPNDAGDIHLVVSYFAPHLPARTEHKRYCTTCKGTGLLAPHHRYGQAWPTECESCDGTGYRVNEEEFCSCRPCLNLEHVLQPGNDIEVPVARVARRAA